ncbi:hypothetical protein ES332_A01G134500v1 [Gossypium tomentosum]|uniref:Uncharacterized protein n=1 Tax=Gossypium tomentosum TaxID=34277 RepID=A0A5D2RSC8_GOSTO|nr:hypothetical protein ES332_A01G134500v1 [Gossypium tomentosum]
MREKGHFPFFGFDFIEGEETSTTLSRGSGQCGCRWSFWCNGTRGAEPLALDVPTKHVGGVRHEGDSETLGFLNYFRLLGLLGL